MAVVHRPEVRREINKNAEVSELTAGLRQVANNHTDRPTQSLVFELLRQCDDLRLVLISILRLPVPAPNKKIKTST